LGEGNELRNLIADNDTEHAIAWAKIMKKQMKLPARPRGWAPRVRDAEWDVARTINNARRQLVKAMNNEDIESAVWHGSRLTRAVVYFSNLYKRGDGIYENPELDAKIADLTKRGIPL
jgi:hypothetical protein